MSYDEERRRLAEKVYMLGEDELIEWLGIDPNLFKIVFERYGETVNEEYEDDNSHFRSYEDVLVDFEENIKPAIPADDAVALREAWNDWTDGLCKDGEISPWAYENWEGPE
jgi:hypothetical protein